MRASTLPLFPNNRDCFFPSREKFPIPSAPSCNISPCSGYSFLIPAPIQNSPIARRAFRGPASEHASQPPQAYSSASLGPVPGRGGGQGADFRQE